ncbi:crossover junction endodeoxyribonuclease RuvC [Candidatus Beckwithbacteria bacterium CG10_big_fil_rev_8_21_14_0_10_34_10]|uniref:Crossover junction endodeoxyribonuclease RuvC n=1 Tax=Candidatus Beckwithbacteria bacterium CG10_big_fil_rev_8_21_14_0_10_34_10 TaxID=1974495 RepID=A0A2H0WAE9_9BACT|nr:MAG: crossover junction endodeoxyribonuclease RuvC [Candidatus Beckwithbacteria bacterium CG10_big_fil_rev_8_21_14_0_10_34_10]
MRILGIDPGLALTGWGMVKKGNEVKLLDYGCIKTSKNDQNHLRLLKIFKDLRKILTKFKPEVVVLEKLFFNTNAKTAILIGEGRGVVKICASLAKIPLYEFTPLQVKDSVVGYGRASKKQVQQMVKLLLKMDKIPKPDDAADALAVALTYCSFNKELI